MEDYCRWHPKFIQTGNEEVAQISEILEYISA